tara:strand:- start:3169 stop:5502 length:2334 start_codon:yes stop_codon:yes gene_type:complete
MNLSERLLRLMHEENYVPQGLKELASALNLDRKEELKLKKLCKALVAEGRVARVKKDKYCLPSDADLTSGTILFRQSGSAKVIPDVKESSKYQEALHVLAEDTSTALHGDQVLVRIKPKWRRQRRRDWTSEEFTYARVLRVLKRGRETIVGTLDRRRDFYYVIPDDPRFFHDVLVPPPTPLKSGVTPKKGNKVVVRLEEWEQRHLSPVGEIEAVLGESHTPMAEYLGVLHRYNLDPEFPESVTKEAKEMPAKVSKAHCAGRLDCKDLLTLTIDPDDAKDFDDALSLETLKDGRVRIGIHIADVSAYVRPGSQLDKEAERRGNSTYLVGTVIPMLPHALSSGICSLLEGEDRLTKTVFVTFSKAGKLESVDFANTVICSNKRFSYKQAYALLTEEDLKKVRKVSGPMGHQTGHAGRSLEEVSDKELKLYQKAVCAFWNIAKRLRAQRMQAGSLDLDMPEVKIYLDKEGYADRIENNPYDESHQLIEEFMLLANECVAKALHGAGFAYISRVHDKPEQEKLNDLRDLLVGFGIQTGDLSNQSEVTKLLTKLKTHPQGYTLKIEFLRSLKQACYRAEADGHYGLHKTFYAHFTSPIRRYSDLIVHRIFDAYLVKSGNETAPKSHEMYLKAKLISMSEHLSHTERNSTEAERESVKIKLLEFFERELDKPKKTPLKAVILEIRSHGMFIELKDSLAFGFIHLSTLSDDLYFARESCLVGRRTRRKFCVGDELDVVVISVNRFKRQMDFQLHEFESTPKRLKKPRRRASSKPREKRKPRRRS